VSNRQGTSQHDTTFFCANMLSLDSMPCFVLPGGI